MAQNNEQLPDVFRCISAAKMVTSSLVAVIIDVRHHFLRIFSLYKRTDVRNLVQNNIKDNLYVNDNGDNLTVDKFGTCRP